MTAENVKDYPKPTIVKSDKVIVAFVRPNVQKLLPNGDVAEGLVISNGQDFIREYDPVEHAVHIKCLREMEAGRTAEGHRVTNMHEMKIISKRPSDEVLEMTKDQHGRGRREIFADLYAKVK